MKIKVRHEVEIDAPDGATHFCGNLLQDPEWYKTSTRNHSGVRVTYLLRFDKGRWLVQDQDLAKQFNLSRHTYLQKLNVGEVNFA